MPATIAASCSTSTAIVHGRNNDRVVVNDLDGLVAFVLHFKQRLAQRQALQAKRDKVLHLQAQAIIEQVKQLAKEEQFDFVTATDRQKCKLFVRLSDSHCLEIHVPFKRFQEMSPQLRKSVAPQSCTTRRAGGLMKAPEGASNMQERA
jgi:hypothetical protein